MPMRHGRLEGPGCGAHGIDVNPLVIAGDRRELVDARLIDIEPVAGSQVRANKRLQFRQRVIRIHP